MSELTAVTSVQATATTNERVARRPGAVVSAASLKGDQFDEQEGERRWRPRGRGFVSHDAPASPGSRRAVDGAGWIAGRGAYRPATCRAHLRRRSRTRWHRQSSGGTVGLRRHRDFFRPRQPRPSISETFGRSRLVGTRNRAPRYGPPATDAAAWG